jgi:hypothetical protein
VSPELTKFVLAKRSIESVVPDLSYVITGDDHVMRLCGAVIHLRGIPHSTPGLVASAVGCHEARVTLGEPAPPDDPYVLPGKWADIRVWPDGDGFKISVRGDDFNDGKTLLDRARRYRNDGGGE